VLTLCASGRRVVLWIGLLATATAACAAPTANEILRRALDLSAEVNDYTAQVQVRGSFAGAPEEVPPFTVYFKRPDKVSIRSRSLVVVPRDALTFGNLARRIEEGAEIYLLGTKVVNGVTLYTLKLKPKAGGEERLLVTIDGRRWTVERMEIVQGERVRAVLNWQHVLIGGRYWMPSVITCQVPGVEGRPGGELTVSFSGYKVNTGLSDALFEATE